MTRRLPIADWPACDRALWNEAVEPGDLFSGGAAAHWSAATRVYAACNYNAWLLWLASKGLLDVETTPAERVTRERVAAYVAEIQTKLAPQSVLTRIQGLHNALQVMEPNSDLKWLGQVRQNLKAQVHPTRDKISRLKPPDELMALGERLMEEAESASQPSARRRAIRYRDGLIIAFLAYRPVRRKNLAMMRLGQHLMKVGGSWRVVFAAEETKTGKPYDAALPTALAPRLERYLDVHRPLLMHGPPTNCNRTVSQIQVDLEAVWVSEDGLPLAYEAVFFQIVAHTKREFGHSVSPHLFRDCAATAVAIGNPKHIGDASLVLGHADPRTTEKHYNHARSLEASRRHGAMLVGLRDSLKTKENR